MQQVDLEALDALAVQRVRVAQQQRVLVDAGDQATAPPDRLPPTDRGPLGRRLQVGWAHLSVGIGFVDGRRRRRAQRRERGAERLVVRRAACGERRGQAREREQSRADAASPVLPDAVGEPQDGQRADGQRQQRDPEPQPADGGARAVRIASRTAPGPLASRREGGVEPLRLLQLVVDVRCAPRAGSRRRLRAPPRRACARSKPASEARTPAIEPAVPERRAARCASPSRPPPGRSPRSAIIAARSPGGSSCRCRVR